MKFIDLTTEYKLTKERISLLTGTAVTIMLCALGTVAVAASVNRQSELDIEQRDLQAQRLYEEAQDAMESSSSASLSAELSESEAESLALENTNPMPQVSSLTASVSEETSDQSTSEAEESTEASSDEAAAETYETTSGESEYYTTVYASQIVNLRTGPGTGYDIVRELASGSTIDVVAVTSDGWYRTYNGNYVLSDLTTSTPPATTATSTAATTASTTAASTTAAATTTTAAPATTTTTTAFTETPSGADTSGMTLVGNCTITFYSPQHMGPGTYCVETATGATCCQGRTVAADWNVIPAGTTIYIENDPLGGDGYYVVEDRGSAVTGNHIDIFADDISSLSTTSRNVYIVN
ncbi:MAG: SH3 domain-containing protein [Clostridiales bacterium]|nr:SH3 domain-containing protein [Clostridiales bacterium]